MATLQRKVTYRLYPNAEQTLRLESALGLHQRLYNTALEERIRIYQAEKRSVSFAEHCRELTRWRKSVPALRAINAHAEQVTLKRIDLAFQAFFRRCKSGENPGFPRYKTVERFRGWGYKEHGNGWKLIPGPNDGAHGWITMQDAGGRIPIRGRSRLPGTPKTCEILHKAGRWYASVTLNVEASSVHREAGTGLAAFDWGVKTFLTIAAEDGTITPVDNPRHLRRQLEAIRQLGRTISRKRRAAQAASGKTTGFPVSASLRRAYAQLARLYGKVARQRQDFLHQTSSWLVKTFGALGTEQLNVASMVQQSPAPAGKRRRGLHREILSTSPSAFLQQVRYKAAEAGTGLEEAPTRKLKPTQRCYACGVLPEKKKLLSERRHACPHCGAQAGRDDNAALVLLHWLKLSLKFTGQELAEVLSGVRHWDGSPNGVAMQHETLGISA